MASGDVLRAKGTNNDANGDVDEKLAVVAGQTFSR
jgi:hypothetical protein